MNAIDIIISEQMPCFFISPHLDDAILSSGSLIYSLSNRTKVSITTIFTKGDSSPHTRFAKKYMQTCGYHIVEKYFNDRKKEDEEVIKSINADFKHLDYIDAAYRKKLNVNRLVALLGRILPELMHLYPFNSDLRSGKIAKDDKNMILDIKRSLINFLNSESEYRIFCPLAIGNHVDHIIIRDICTEIFPPEKIIFWTDYPYINWGNTAEEFIKKIGLKSFVWNKNLEKKHELILGYKTQIPAIFPKGLPENLPEVYYLKS